MEVFSFILYFAISKFSSEIDKLAINNNNNSIDDTDCFIYAGMDNLNSLNTFSHSVLTTPLRVGIHPHRVAVTRHSPLLFLLTQVVQKSSLYLTSTGAGGKSEIQDRETGRDRLHESHIVEGREK